jgi:hypothetical protein
MKKFKWNVTIEVDRTWVTKAPTPESIKAAQVGEE